MTVVGILMRVVKACASFICFGILLFTAEKGRFKGMSGGTMTGSLSPSPKLVTLLYKFTQITRNA